MPYLKLIAFSLLGAAGLLAQSTMSCSSDDMRRHYCGADTSRGVQMIRQHSDAACIEGRTWGYDRRGIWVDRGCRADFALGGGWNGSGRGYGYGNGNGRYGNGGYGNGGYGPYASGPYNSNGGYNGNYSGQQFYCASDDMRRHYCSANTGGGVQMLRQRSDAACIQGRTWGYDRRGVWVDRGCRADFATGTGYNNQGGYRNRGYSNHDYRGDRDPYYRRYPSPY